MSPRPKKQKAVERPALPVDLLRKVRRIEITTNRLVDQGVAGDYHSVFRGRGMEFSEVRPYQPGDDVRIIDWNVTARMALAPRWWLATCSSFFDPKDDAITSCDWCATYCPGRRAA